MWIAILIFAITASFIQQYITQNKKREDEAFAQEFMDHHLSKFKESVPDTSLTLYSHTSPVYPAMAFGVDNEVLNIFPNPVAINHYTQSLSIPVKQIIYFESAGEITYDHKITSRLANPVGAVIVGLIGGGIGAIAYGKPEFSGEAIPYDNRETVLLYYSDSGITKGGNNSVCYTMRKDVPDGRIIVLSATANDDTYQLIFRNSYRGCQKVPLVKLEGLVSYDIEQTYSASNLEEKGISEIMDKLKERNKDFFEKDYTIITYKKYTGALRNLGYRLHDGLYFRNTEGIDAINGQNILVLGKPMLPMNAIVSQAVCAGCQPKTCGKATHRIRRCGYEFDFFGFDDDTLNMLLMHSIDRVYACTPAAATTTASQNKKVVRDNGRTNTRQEQRKNQYN